MSRRIGANTKRSGGGGVIFAVLGLAVVAAVIFARLYGSREVGAPTAPRTVRGCAQAAHAYASHASSTWITFSGTVHTVLPDDTQGLKHQRFIVGCSSGQTVLVVNDIDIGTRVPVAVGDRLTVRGQYIWNDRGGLVHWTHHDPEGGQGGWISFRGRVYALNQFGHTGFPLMTRSSPV